MTACATACASCPRAPGLQDMYAATRAAGFGAEVKRRILIGTYVLSAGFYDAYYTQAQKVRTLIARDFKDGVRKLRRCCSPRPRRAPRSRLGDKSDDPLAMYLNDVFSVPACARRAAGDVGARRAQPRGPAARARS